MVYKYQAHKREHDRYDFTDLLFRYAGIGITKDLEIYSTCPEGSVPQDVKIWFWDEHQDTSVLLDMVTQRLSEDCQDVYMLGDAYQAVYGFSGSDHRVFKARENAAKDEGNRILLNRSWRNPPQVLEWGESVLREDKAYEERHPFSEVCDGSVGMMRTGLFLENLERLVDTDTLIIARTWFALDSLKRRLDQMCIPWRSCQEERKSRWESPVKIAYTLTMRDLKDGAKISEQDWRRVTDTLGQKFEGKELFERGVKAKWKKMSCSGENVKTLADLKEWGATEWFTQFVQQDKWRLDTVLLLDDAIEKHGIRVVRNPGIRIGSCHSVKGMEAENVFCLATSSERASGDGIDFWEDLFLKYVAITRASRHFRVVVDPVDHARGKRLFLPCPKGFWTFDEEFVDVGVRNTGEVPEMVFGQGLDLGVQISGRNLRQSGDSGHTDVSAGDLPGHRVQDADREAVGDSEVRAVEDSYEWINI